MLFFLTFIIVINSCNKTDDYVKLENIDDCYIYNNHTYFYMKHKTDWNDAKKACETEEGHLLIIEEKKENDFIKKIIDDHTWLGLTDVENEGFWKWVDNTFLLWSDWAEGMPSNRGTDNYAHYHSKKNYSWNDNYNRNRMYFICEIERKINDIMKIKEIKTNLLNSILTYQAERIVKPYKDIKGCYHYNGHTYFYIDTEVNWKVAKAVCENLRGHLLIIENESENNFIKKIIDEYTWLGLTDEETESIWKWINGEPLYFTDWLKGQPDNKEQEHYVHYHYYAENYSWNDIEYSRNFKFICEYDFEITDIE